MTTQPTDASRIQAEASRTATAVQLAVLDRRYSDIQIITRDLDTDVLRAVIAELGLIWFDAIRWNCNVGRVRVAVAADALDQATMDSGPPAGATP